MDYNAAALEMHAKYPGKLTVNSLFEVKDRDALSTAYTPGVAEPCRQIKANPDDVYKYTFKGRTVAVVTNGTAVLGLGNIGPEAGLPVMEGKCVLFKEFGGVDAFPICLNASTREKVIAAVKAIAPTFGGINLEDIRSPECFDIEAELERDLDIPVFHDDQHGTAIIVLAGVLNALKVVGKRLEDVKIVQNGPGAAGTAIIKMLQVAGAKNIVAVDEHGILYPGRPAGLADHKEWLATVTNPEHLTGTLADAVRGADVFIGTSVAGALTTEMAATMAPDAIVFAMANPNPEIMPDAAKAAGVRVIGTGRSDFPNQVNNVLAFPGIFKGALSVRARDINPQMKMAAAKAIAGLIPENELTRQAGIPMDPHTKGAVVYENMETGIPGVFACGNVVQVHDLVDFVSGESDRAGAAAAAYVLHGETPDAAVLDLVPGNGVGYTVPQRVRPADVDKGVEISFRVRQNYGPSQITVTCSGRQLARFKRQRMAPGEMEHIALPKVLLEKADGPLTVAVEEVIAE